MVYDCPQRRELSVWAEVGEAVLLNLQPHKWVISPNNTHKLETNCVLQVYIHKS